MPGRDPLPRWLGALDKFLLFPLGCSPYQRHNRASRRDPLPQLPLFTAIGIIG